MFNPTIGRTTTIDALGNMTLLRQRPLQRAGDSMLAIYFTWRNVRTSRPIFQPNFPRERIDMSVDPFTGRNPSYCFVELESKEQAEKAMAELDGREILGRPVKIKPGVPKARGSQANGKGITTTPENKDPPRYAFDRWKRSDAAEVQAELSTGYAEGRRLFVGGLPRVSNQLLVNQKIMELFEGFTLEAISKIISPTGSNRPKVGNDYYLFVDLPTAEEATSAAQALNGKRGPWGHPIRVGKSTNRSRKLDERKRWDEYRTLHNKQS